ncbi:MAG TPA: hypothetical protein VH351_15085 [Bryobacteraceae bacterium]|jgi:hypothetical protein|nr:hypothetical protein [Bryobacteraceae bacterium]
MSYAEVFSYALLLKGAERAVQILELLEENKREEVKAVLESLKGIPAEGIRRLWRERRATEDLPKTAGA